MHPVHRKYLTVKPVHEAGYDSYLTAKVLIRLATKLEGAEQSAPTDDSSMPTTLNDSLGEEPAATHNGHSDSSTEGVPLPAKMLDIPNEKRKVGPPTPPAKRKAKGVPPPTAFSHPTIFGILADESSSEEDLIDLGLEVPGFMKSPKSKGAKRESLNRQLSPPPATMMPPFDSEFWNAYLNKLRVNGTAEGVCYMKAVG